MWVKKKIVTPLAVAALCAGCAFATINPVTGRVSTTAIGQSKITVVCTLPPREPQRIECVVDTTGGAVSEGFTEVLKKVLDIPTAIAKFFVPLPI